MQGIKKHFGTKLRKTYPHKQLPANVMNAHPDKRCIVHTISPEAKKNMQALTQTRRNNRGLIFAWAMDQD